MLTITFSKHHFDQAWLANVLKILFAFFVVTSSLLEHRAVSLQQLCFMVTLGVVAHIYTMHTHNVTLIFKDISILDVTSVQIHVIICLR